MPNPFFQFKKFTVFHDRCAMKVTTDACLFGAWVADQLEGTQNLRALDIGTGTGLLALMLAQKTGFYIDAVELDTAAAGQAQENIAASPWNSRIAVHHADIQQFEPNHPFDYIISNPPFYEKEIVSSKSNRNMAHHAEGLRLDQLFASIKRNLAANGTAYLLMPSKRIKDIEAILKAESFFIYQKVEVHPSTIHPSFRLFLSIKMKPDHPVHNTSLYIKEESGTYTREFTGLLKDYYLYL